MMNIIKGKPLALASVVIVLGVVALVLLANQTANNPLISKSPSPTGTSLPIPSSTPGLDNLIWLDEPLANQAVKSPLLIRGEARGMWYFEASFPVRIYDANGKELGVVPAEAQDEWMTQDFVPFKAVLNFSKPSTDTGTLVLQKDNPSGLSEHDAELRVAIRFDLKNWEASPSLSRCKPTGCSGQICSDEDVTTTCEFKEEYACYKNAKCERQSDGKCGWTPTEELVMCLSAAFQNESQ